MIAFLAHNWWTFVVRGIAALIFGILAFAWPLPTLFALVILYGAYALVDGAFAIVGAVQAASSKQQWGWLAFEGVVGLAAACIAFLYPGLTALVLLYIIAFWAILTGIFEIAAAIRLRARSGEWALWLSGIVSVAFGILLVIRPAAGAMAVVWIIGVYAIVFGVFTTAVGVRLRAYAT